MHHVTVVENYVKARELLVTKITSFLHISCVTKFKGYDKHEDSDSVHPGNTLYL